MMNNACPPCITASAGTDVAQDFIIITSCLPRIIIRVYNYCLLFPLQDIAGSYLNKLSNIPYCWPPPEARALSQSPCGRTLFQAG